MSVSSCIPNIKSFPSIGADQTSTNIFIVQLVWETGSVYMGNEKLLTWITQDFETAD